MSFYKNFIGIDIGKFNFVTSVHGSNQTYEYENNPAGIAKFISSHKKLLKADTLCVLETTGGYEMLLLLTLCNYNYKVHRSDNRKVKSFIKSYGNAAKTDALDAKALALYGFERNEKLALYQPISKRAYELYQLVQRRQDLKRTLVSEKNRRQAPAISDSVKNSCAKLIEIISDEIESITHTISALIKEDKALEAMKDVLKTVPGIGDIIANELLILMPELGKLDRRQIASLAGCAPRANDSGRSSGYRRTSPGRAIIKPILFMAAMAARKSNSSFKTFYENLINRGKKKMVALTALMRKIITTANARARDYISNSVVIKI